MPEFGFPSHEGFAVKQNVIKIPESVIQEQGVIVNRFAQQVLEPSLRYLASPEYLLNNLYFTIPLNNPTAVQTTPWQWGRVLSIATGFIPYAYGIVGGNVHSKGNNVTGFLYDKLNTDYPQTHSSDPEGFFGNEDAQSELEISNDLLANGLRSYLTLGYVVFDPQIFANWLHTSVFPHVPNANARNYVLKNYQRVLTNGHFPSILFRVGGTFDRLGYLQHIPDSKSQAHILGEKYEQARAAALLAKELNYNSLLKPLLNDDTRKVSSSLWQIAHMEAINENDFQCYLRLVKSLQQQNYRGVQTLSFSNYKHYKYALASSLAVAEHDIDLTLTHCDYETLTSGAIVRFPPETYLKTLVALGCFNGYANDYLRKFNLAFSEHYAHAMVINYLGTPI